MTAPWNRLSDFLSKQVATLSYELNEHVAPRLRALHEPLDRWIGDLPPWSSRACAVGLLLVGLACAVAMKRRSVYLGAPDQARWRDLRIWSALALLPYILIYLFL